MRQPSEAAFRRLLILASGAAVLAPGKRDWQPLLRRGWVEPAWLSAHPPPPLQITADGLRALADWLDRTGGWDPDRFKTQRETSA